MSEQEESWTGAESRALKNLPRELAPRPELEDRIVAALARRRLLISRSRSARGWRAMAALAAGILLVGSGVWIGRALAPRPSHGSTAAAAPPQFVLFLLRGAESDRPEEESGRVAEYRAWARGLAASGRSVAGEKLDDRAERLGAGAGATSLPPEEEIRGYFVISAASLDDAVAVARRCPHLKHGGRIVVRPIMPT